MNKDFITELKNSSFFSYLFEDNDVIMIYLGGSRAFNEHSENSDYDIVILTKNKPHRKEGLFGLEYKGRKVHWYYEELFDLFLPITENWNILEPISTVNLLTVLDNIIYENPKYKAEINYILENHKELAKVGAWNFLTYNNQFHEVLETNSAPRAGKISYHIYNCYCIALDKEIDIEFAKWIKTAGAQKVKELLDIVLEANEYYQEHKNEIKQKRSYLLSKLKEVQ